MGSGERSLRNFHLHLPHLHHHHHHHGGKKQVIRDVPKGCLAIKVGQGKEQQRFVIPVIYFNHPLFIQLLKEAEEEYGFDQKGTITIPCHVEEFRSVQGMIDREKSLHHHHHHQHHHHHHTHRHLFNWRPTKLFVFGDSYADTGNNRKSVASSWKQPYGITFPGKPCGRFSDGRVLTDFLARFIGVKSPIPYRFRKVGVNHLKYGVNFAYGGTGVFKTSVLDPNMTTQIDFFQKLIENSSIFTPKELHSSVALVTGPGNDYATYVATNGSVQGWQPFITSIVNQLTVNMKRIYALGVGKVVVTALQPLGCLPSRSASFSFQQCNGTENALVGFHNLLLRQAVAKLNNETKNSFIIVDLYASFMSVFKNKGDLGSIKFENPLRPCCIGINTGFFCGSVDESGAKKYTICKNPESAFFWDTAHPTQQGWRAVYSALQATLEQLY